MSEMKSEKALDSFCGYCVTHPEERFWQALRNWSGAAFILAVSNRYNSESNIIVRNHDTFPIDGRGEF